MNRFYLQITPFINTPSSAKVKNVTCKLIFEPILLSFQLEMQEILEQILAALAVVAILMVACSLIACCYNCINRRFRLRTAVEERRPLQPTSDTTSDTTTSYV